jgi:hypothetical protein
MFIILSNRSAYFLSKLIAETPSNMLGPILFSLILYFAIGLNPVRSQAKSIK